MHNHTRGYLEGNRKNSTTLAQKLTKIFALATCTCKFLFLSPPALLARTSASTILRLFSQWRINIDTKRTHMGYMGSDILPAIGD